MSDLMQLLVCIIENMPSYIALYMIYCLYIKLTSTIHLSNIVFAAKKINNEMAPYSVTNTLNSVELFAKNIAPEEYSQTITTIFDSIRKDIM